MNWSPKNKGITVILKNKLIDSFWKYSKIKTQPENVLDKAAEKKKSTEKAIWKEATDFNKKSLCKYVMYFRGFSINK